MAIAQSPPSTVKPTTNGAPSTLQALAQIIGTSVTTLESIYQAHGTSFPSLDIPQYTPGPLWDDEQANHAATVIMSAAYQLIATVCPPSKHYTNLDGGGMYVSGGLQYVIETSVPDILKEGDPKGMHVDDIAKQINVPTDAKCLGRVLRFLASHFYFREVSPNVFAHNRTSFILCKDKSLQEIRDNPLTQYSGTTAAALLGHVLNEGLPSAAHMSSWLQAPKDSVGPSPFSLAFKADNIWEWFEQPGNELKRNRFASLMANCNNNWPNDVLTGAIDWQSYPEDSTVVDVGGNLGAVTLVLARNFPHLRYIIQDLDQVIEGADGTKEFWKKQHPKFVESGKIEFQAHDFFMPNPVIEPDVFVMRSILHDWSTERATSILKNLRAAAKPSTKLLCFDHIMPYACADDSRSTNTLVLNGKSIGASSSKSHDPFSTTAPWPLLPNWGPPVGGMIAASDMAMMNVCDGYAQERTIDEFRELGALSGWKLEKSVKGRIGTIIFAPV